MEAFSNVTDDVLYMILQSKDKRLESFRDLVKYIMNRKLYKCVGQTQIRTDGVVKLNYGLEDKDPIKHVKFYSKFDVDKLFPINKEQVSYVLPETFSEQIVRVYCKSSSASEIEIVKASFSEWCEDKGYPKPKLLMKPVQLYEKNIVELLYQKPDTVI